MKQYPTWSSLKNPVKFRIPTADNLVPFRLDIEVDGQRSRDAFTWIPSDPDSDVIYFAIQTVKDLKLPPAFVSQISQSIQKHINSAPYKVPRIPPLHSLQSTTGRKRSFITQAYSEEDEEVAHQVLNEILSKLDNNRSSMNELCSDHINKLCKQRKLRASSKLLHLLRDQHAIYSLQAYNLLLGAACEENDIKIVTQVFKDLLLHRLPTNAATYFIVAKAVSNSNDSTSLLNFVEEISEPISTENVTVFNRIIYAFADCGHVDNALLVFGHMKSLKREPDLITYNTVLGILGKTGRVDEMLREFDSMKKSNVTPDIVSYNTLINSLRKVGRLDLCVEFSKEMMKVGVEPDLRTYTALIEGVGRAGKVEESLRLFEEMKRCRIRPSVYVYRSLISNLKRMGMSELSRKFSDEMNACMADLVGPSDFKKKL